MSSFLPEPDPILRDRILGCIISEYDPINTPEKQRWKNQYCQHRKSGKLSIIGS